MQQNWGFLYRMAESDGYDQHVWDYYFWLNVYQALK